VFHEANRHKGKRTKAKKTSIMYNDVCAPT
jgi:hypothetical protein